MGARRREAGSVNFSVGISDLATNARDRVVAVDAQRHQIVVFHPRQDAVAARPRRAIDAMVNL
jgi:hypothetical protein